jgi:hypothetical protein
MPYYRLCFGKNGRAGCFDEFQAGDDAAALREAERHLRGGEGDLWCGDRRVAVIGPRGTMPTPARPPAAQPRHAF